MASFAIQVDRLHHKASPFSLSESDKRILELHGTLHFVHCPHKHHVWPRDVFQEELGKLNPTWEAFVKDAHGGEVKTNPDGDVSSGCASKEIFSPDPCFTGRARWSQLRIIHRSIMSCL